MKKIIFLFLVAILLISSCFAEVFTDINNHWAQASILNTYHCGFVNGYSDGTFKPNNTITRAEFVTILSKVLDSYIIIDVDGYDDIFNHYDLDHSHWCKSAYDKLIYYGYVFSNQDSTSKNKGMDFICPILGNLFKASEPITRAEAVSLIAYFLDESKFDDNKPISFSDIEDSPLKEYINKFCKTKIIKGYSDGTFKPNNTITRAEVCTIISDFYYNKEFFKSIDWVNEITIKKIDIEYLEPEEVLVEFLNYETNGLYKYAYQFLSGNYKLNNSLFDYKDYMKKTSSHILPNSITDSHISKKEITKQENKDGSLTLQFEAEDSQTYSIDFIAVGNNWYINSKMY